MNINNVYTTISQGRTHIAADTKYIGSLNTYNNCFSRFFACLFCRSRIVEFDGKIRSVNKKSYQNLLRSLLSQEQIEGLGQERMFRKVAEQSKLPTGNVRMRDAISHSKRQALFQKLVMAISTENTTEALLMIGKGAELDGPYYERERLNPTFQSDSDDLVSKRYRFTVFKAPPIMQAAKKGNRILVTRLKEAGANVTATGQEYRFKRDMTSVQHHPGLRGETVTILTKDKRINKQDYKLEDETLNLIAIEASSINE